MPLQTKSERLHIDLGRLIAATQPGDRLPSEPDLAKRLGVSRATLREAMRTYETRGMIRRKQGSGTYVTHPSGVIDSGLEILESIETLASRSNMPVSMADLVIEQRPSTEEEAQALKLNLGEEVIRVRRVINAEDRPVAYLIDTLPITILHPQELNDKFHGSVLDFLLERETPELGMSRTELNAVTASPKIARALGIQRGDVLLLFTAYLYSADGNIVDYSHCYFLPGYFRFHVIRRVG